MVLSLPTTIDRSDNRWANQRTFAHPTLTGVKLGKDVKLEKGVVVE